VGDEVGDAVGQGVGFAAPGTGDDEERTNTGLVDTHGNGVPLLRIEVTEIGGIHGADGSAGV
jgi:hypothetical protein